MRHGAFSDRAIEKAAEQIREALADLGLDFLSDPTLAPALRRYVRAEARSLLLHRYVMEKAEAEGVESVKPYLWQEASE